MLLIFLGFLLLTSIAFGIPFLMGGDNRARAANRGLILATFAAFAYLIGVVVVRGGL